MRFVDAPSVGKCQYPSYGGSTVFSVAWTLCLPIAKRGSCLCRRAAWRFGKDWWRGVAAVSAQLLGGLLIHEGSLAGWPPMVFNGAIRPSDGGACIVGHSSN